MTYLRTFAFVTLVGAGVVTATAVDAAPYAVPVPAPTMQTTPVGNGYGPLPYGIYGNRHRFRARTSYGIGYRGRGTRTGGPSGGLPGRS